MEIWKDVLGYEGLYKVSNLGNVYSFKTNKILSKHNDSNKYVLYNLGGKIFSGHRLVAIHFIDNPKNLPIVNHKNEIKNDNVSENLEWCDNSYNLNYKEAMYRRTKNMKGIHKELSVYQYDLNGHLINKYDSLHEAERKTGAMAQNIWHCLEGTRYMAGGYYWRKYEVDKLINFKKVVCQYDLNNNLIDKYDDQKIASKKTGIGDSSICRALKSKTNFSKGYYWRYETI